MVAADQLLDVRRNSRDVHQLLGQSKIIPESPSVLQFGGNDSLQLFQASELYNKVSQSNKCQEYTSLNLNCGCPSPVVSGKKCFGAALMRDPTHVAKLVRAMNYGVEGKLPISVTCRIGLYENNDNTPFTSEIYNKQPDKQEYDKLQRFIDTVASDGIVTSFIIHARIAILGGTVSAADNQKIPLLTYEYVRRLTDEFPELDFVLNGGIHSLAQANEELGQCNSMGGIMVGRAFVADPWRVLMADELLFGDHDGQRQLCTSRRQLLEAYGRHVDFEELHNEPALVRRSLLDPVVHLFAGESNSKKFRMELDEIAGRPERLEREATARVWSVGSSDSTTSRLASAFSASSEQSVGWDDLQAMDDARPAWDQNEPPLSELILEAAQRNFGDDLLDLGRRESYDKKIWEEQDALRRKNDKRVVSTGTSKKDSSSGMKVSGGVVDGWFNNGLN